MQIKSAAPFFVVLSQAFNPGWRAYEGSPSWLELMLGVARPVGRHFMANYYANGWYFDQPGDYRLTLYYWPQSLLYLGLIASAVIWGLLVLGWLYWRRYHEKADDDLHGKGMSTQKG